MLHPGTLISFWSLNHLDLTDTLNEEIWRASPARGAALKMRLRLDRHGGLQDMNLDTLGGLPWVPDLVGRRWRERDSVLVVGSAYAPFIHPWAGRTSAMDTRDYRDAKNAAEFLRCFFSTVVAGDRAYYEPIGELLSGITSPDRVVLTDLCRASFVRRDGPEKMTSGDAAVQDAPDVYGAYVEAGEDWTWQRIEQCAGRVIVTLGNIAEQGLLEVFRRHGYALSIPAAPHVMYAPVRPGASGSITRPTTSADQRRRAGWWWRAVRGDREYRVAAVVHPSYRNVYDPGFAHSRELIIAARISVTPARVDRPDQPKMAMNDPAASFGVANPKNPEPRAIPSAASFGESDPQRLNETHRKKITHERGSFSLKASLIVPESMDTMFEFVVNYKGTYCATYQMTKAQIYQCRPLVQAMETPSYTVRGEYHWSWGAIPQEVEKFRVQDSLETHIPLAGTATPAAGPHPAAGLLGGARGGKGQG